MQLRILVLVLFLLVPTSGHSQDLGKIASSNIYASKGQVLYQTGKTKEAIESLQKAIEIRPEHGIAHYYLAASYMKLDQIQEANDLLTAYLTYVQDPNIWLSDYDREHIAKCKILLKSIQKKLAKNIK